LMSSPGPSFPAGFFTEKSGYLTYFTLPHLRATGEACPSDYADNAATETSRTATCAAEAILIAPTTSA
jgi:hypothetical protein